jgi:hypothetical protein
MQWQKKKNKKEIGVTGSNYPQSQHNSPALNCPLKKSTEFTPLPLHCEHRIAPACPLYTEFIYIYNLHTLSISISPSSSWKCEHSFK